MNLGLVLYLISLLDNFAIIMLVALAIITIFICLYSLDDLTWLKKMKTWKRVIILLSLGGFGINIYPNSIKRRYV